MPSRKRKLPCPADAPQDDDDEEEEVEDGGRDGGVDQDAAATAPPVPLHIVEGEIVFASETASSSKSYVAMVDRILTDGRAVVIWLEGGGGKSAPLAFDLIRPPSEGRRSRHPKAGVYTNNGTGRQSTAVSGSRKNQSTKGPAPTKKIQQKKSKKKKPKKPDKKRSAPRSGGNGGGQRSAASNDPDVDHDQGDDGDGGGDARRDDPDVDPVDDNDDGGDGGGDVRRGNVHVPAHISEGRQVQARQRAEQTAKHVATVVEVDAAAGEATVRWDTGAVSDPLPFSLILPPLSGPRSSRATRTANDAPRPNKRGRRSRATEADKSDAPRPMKRGRRSRATEAVNPRQPRPRSTCPTTTIPNTKAAALMSRFTARISTVMDFTETMKIGRGSTRCRSWTVRKLSRKGSSSVRKRQT